MSREAIIAKVKTAGLVPMPVYGHTYDMAAEAIRRGVLLGRQAMKARAITVCEDPEPGLVHSKFPIRRRYVEATLVPALRAIGLDASVFPAVTPKESEVRDGRLHARSRSGTVRNLDQHRLVANSVPPPLAKAIATQIITVLA